MVRPLMSGLLGMMSKLERATLNLSMLRRDFTACTTTATAVAGPGKWNQAVVRFSHCLRLHASSSRRPDKYTINCLSCLYQPH